MTNPNQLSFLPSIKEESIANIKRYCAEAKEKKVSKKYIKTPSIKHLL